MASKRCRESSRGGRSSSCFTRKRRRYNKDITPDIPSQDSISTETALNNFLVLSEIFSRLSPTDLKNCCEVNKPWRDIAGKMLYLYEVTWEYDCTMKIKTTKGYENPVIELRNSHFLTEMDFLENHRHRSPFISLKINRRYLPYEQLHEEQFLTKVGHLVFKLEYTYCIYRYRRSYFQRPPVQPEIFIKYLTDFFPNIEELQLPDLQLTKTFSRGTDVKSCPKLSRLRTLDFGSMSRISSNRVVAALLQLMPNIETIENFPFLMLKILQPNHKLNAIRSVTFNGGYSNRKDDAAMRYLVEMNLKLRSIIIGKRIRTQKNLDFIQRNKFQFESLLELGKSTVEEITLPPLETIGFLKFPDQMSALTHLRFRGRLSHENQFSYFPKDFDLLGRFPKLNKVTIEFNNFWIRSQEQIKHCFPDHTFGSDKLGDAIKHLGITADLPKASQRNILKIFPHVGHIETVMHDLSAIPRGASRFYF